jgi:S-layer homology domain
VLRKVARTGGLAALLLALVGALYATDFYVAPNGSSSGNGSIGSPWDLQTALNQPSSVHPGDTIWLRGGTYSGVGHYVGNLNGTAANPIIVRQYAGERATIDGNYAGNLDTLEIHGSYTWYWGFEIFNSDPTRYTSDGNDPPRRGEGVEMLGLDNKMINMIVHDTSQGVLNGSGTNGAEIYGNLLYYNGYDSPDRGHGHGAYVQNDPGNVVKKVTDNIIFEQFGYGIHGYTTNTGLANLDIEGNTSFDNGGLSQVSGWSTNILLGGLQVALNPIISNNFTYNQVHDGANNTGYSAGCTNPTISSNYLDSGTALKLVGCTGITMTSNTFYGSISGFTQSQFPNNTYYSSQPTGVKVFVRPNAYEAGRANITIFNWDHDPTVPVDLSGILSAGTYFEIRNVQNYFGDAVVSGTYDGSPVQIPMTGLSVASPVGAATPNPTGPAFNAFILTSTLGPDEFYDVPQSNPFHDAIHTIAADGVSAGCGNGDFCPNASVSRAQMAVFLLKAKHGASYAPPAATGRVFSDVPAGSFAASWIEELAAEAISSGCGGGSFCPTESVTRAQMAVFLLKALEGASYAPPPASGSVFSDVPAKAFAASWIEDLAARGITAGCGVGKYCPTSPSARGQMAVFLVRTFSLP